MDDQRKIPIVSPTNDIYGELEINIIRVTNLPENFCSSIYCEYSFYVNDEKFSTEVYPGKCANPEINYTRQHHVDCVTKFLIDYLAEDTLVIKVYGQQELKKKKGEKK